MRLLKKINGILGVIAIAVAVIYWFDLDNLLIKKAEPLLKGLAAVKKMTKAQQSGQNG